MFSAKGSVMFPSLDVAAVEGLEVCFLLGAQDWGAGTALALRLATLLFCCSLPCSVSPTSVVVCCCPSSPRRG